MKYFKFAVLFFVSMFCFNFANAGVWSVAVAENSSLAPDFPTAVTVATPLNPATAQQHGHPNATQQPVGSYCQNIVDSNGNTTVINHLGYTIIWGPMPPRPLLVRRGAMTFWRQTCI